MSNEYYVVEYLISTNLKNYYRFANHRCIKRLIKNEYTTLSSDHQYNHIKIAKKPSLSATKKGHKYTSQHDNWTKSIIKKFFLDGAK